MCMYMYGDRATLLAELAEWWLCSCAGRVPLAEPYLT